MNAYLAWCFGFAAAIGGGVYLITQGHYWLGFFCLLIGGSLSAKSDKEKSE